MGTELLAALPSIIGLIGSLWQTFNAKKNLPAPPNLPDIYQTQLQPIFTEYSKILAGTMPAAIQQYLDLLEKQGAGAYTNQVLAGMNALQQRGGITGGVTNLPQTIAATQTLGQARQTAVSNIAQQYANALGQYAALKSIYPELAKGAYGLESAYKTQLANLIASGTMGMGTDILNILRAFGVKV